MLSGGSQRARERDVKRPGRMLGRRNCTHGSEQQQLLACLGHLPVSVTAANAFKLKHCCAR